MQSCVRLLLLLLQVILSSPRGRAWNQYSPSLGSTMNVAFLAQVYANYIEPGGGSEAKKAKRYSCWAQTQVCHSLNVRTTCVANIIKRNVATNTAAGHRNAGMSLPCSASVYAP